ncbi:CD3337/EF1877 family mobilome membrane protein [Carnobacterium divergens]|uniref:CD3337/EF1877 family mobilome membrane protein n=1 Tax=Carnobacterium divergens TaxID=2748 RepID=UPI00288CA351|nr:hypothetical protein [Carnobacterium divergens]MDT2010824.1 hypothetical protein [Carnobacterium divergens]
MLIDKYNMMSYKSLIDPETKWYWFGLDDKMVSFMNTGVDLILGFNNLLAQVVDYGLNHLYELSVFDSKVSEIFTTTSSLWNTMYNTFKILFFSIAMFYVIKDFMTKGVQQAFIRLLIFMSIFGFNSVFFSSGDYYLKQVNGLSNSIQDEVVGTALLGVNDANVSLIDTNSDEYKKLSPTDKMREAFFSVAVFKPFALINFGDQAFPDPDNINEKPGMKEKDFDKFLIKGEEYSQKQQDEINENVEKSSENNPYLTTKAIGNKYAIAIGSLLNTLFFGLIIFFLTLLKLVLEIIVLGLCLILPIVGMLSLLPPFQNAIFKALGTIVGVFAVKIVSGLGIAIVLLFVGIVDSIIPPITIVGFFSGLIVKALLILIIWKGRDKLFKFITGGRVNTNNKFTRKFDRKVGNYTKAGINKGAEFAGNVGNEAKNFVSGQADGVKERIQDSGSSIRDQAILNAAQNMKDTEFQEPLQLGNSDVVYNGVEPTEDSNGFSDYSDTVSTVNDFDRKEVSEEVGMNQTEFDDTEGLSNSTMSDVPFDDVQEFDDEYEENRIDQTTYYYHDFEEIEEEFNPETIEIQDQDVEQIVNVDSFVNDDINSLDSIPEEIQLDQLIEVKTEIEQAIDPELIHSEELLDVGDSDEII